MFDQMKQLFELQKKAKEMQRVLDDLKVERVSTGGKASVTLNGNFKVVSLTIDESALVPGNKAALEKTLSDLFTDAAEEVRSQTARQAAGMMKGMRLPGMG